MAQTPAPKASNRRRPIPGEDPSVARLTAMIAALTSELAVVRERLDTVERLSESAGTFTRDQVEAFEPSPQAEAERDALRRRTVEKVYRPLRDDAERAARATRSKTLP